MLNELCNSLKIAGCNTLLVFIIYGNKMTVEKLEVWESKRLILRCHGIKNKKDKISYSIFMRVRSWSKQAASTTQVYSYDE